MDERGWIDLGKKRILSILKTYRVSFQKHLEIKISEAGPLNQRVEPVLLTVALKELKEEEAVKILQVDGINMDFIGAPDYSGGGDASRFRRIQRLYKEFDAYVKLDHYCGLYLEKLLFDTLLELEDQYHVLGRGPVIGSNDKLIKPSGSEIMFYGGKEVYGKAGFDLFAIHKETNIPIGIEAKNIRKWLYSDTEEVWRMIARGCSLGCLPIMAARKISYVTRARLFSQCGILGFETQFQYFNPDVLQDSQLFKDIIDKKGLGFADIKTIEKVPNHFKRFFEEILPENIEEYHQRFMKNKDLLEFYAIDEGLAEKKINGGKRRKLYREFEEELMS